MTCIIRVLFMQPDTPTQLAEDLKAVIEGDNRPFASYRKSSKSGGCDSGYMTVGKRTADKEVSSSQVIPNHHVSVLYKKFKLCHVCNL